MLFFSERNCAYELFHFSAMPLQLPRRYILHHHDILQDTGTQKHYDTLTIWVKVEHDEILRYMVNTLQNGRKNKFSPSLFRVTSKHARPILPTKAGLVRLVSKLSSNSEKAS